MKSSHVYLKTDRVISNSFYRQKKQHPNFKSKCLNLTQLYFIRLRLYGSYSLSPVNTKRKRTYKTDHRILFQYRVDQVMIRLLISNTFNDILEFENELPMIMP